MRRYQCLETNPMIRFVSVFVACEQASRSRITRTSLPARRPINLLRSSKPGACSQASVFEAKLEHNTTGRSFGIHFSVSLSAIVLINISSSYG